MGQLPDDYSISQDGTIVRKEEEPKKSGGASVLIAILVVCISLIVIGVMVSKINDAYSYACSMRSRFEYPTWRSSNHKDNSTSYKEYTLALDYLDEVRVDYNVSSEPNYDILTITLVDPSGEEDILCTASGVSQQTVWRTIYGQGGVYKLKVQYKKDGSERRNKDAASIDGLCVYKSRLQDVWNRLSW